MKATKIRDKLVGGSQERAVSPVIGVILMVAITVILAAVIAAFVMDLGDMSGSANAGIDFSESGEHVDVQVIDEGNTDSIYVEIEGEDGTAYLNPDPEVNDEEASWSVGDSVEINSADIGADSSGGAYEVEDEDDVTGSINDADDNVEEEDTISEIIVYGEVDGERQVVATWDR